MAEGQARVGQTVGGRAARPGVGRAGEDGRRVAQRQDPLPKDWFSTEQHYTERLDINLDGSIAS